MQLSNYRIDRDGIIVINSIIFYIRKLHSIAAHLLRLHNRRKELSFGVFEFFFFLFLLLPFEFFLIHELIGIILTQDIALVAVDTQDCAETDKLKEAYEYRCEREKVLRILHRVCNPEVNWNSYAEE